MVHIRKIFKKIYICYKVNEKLARVQNWTSVEKCSPQRGLRCLGLVEREAAVSLRPDLSLVFSAV